MATGGYAMFHSVRPTLGAHVARREGVGIALDKRATTAWRAASEVWKPVSSRVIMAKLKWSSQWLQRSNETIWSLKFRHFIMM